jgi:hypothetical protein
MIAARMRPLAASPLSLHRHLPERSSPSRVRFAALNRRALDRCGPFRKLILDKGKGANATMLTRPPNPKIRSPPLDDVNNLKA